VAGHVAAAAGVGVVAPGAADAGGALEDDVVDAGLAERRADGHTTEPGPDHRGAVVPPIIHPRIVHGAVPGVKPAFGWPLADARPALD
jgi:hypothetical protein